MTATGAFIWFIWGGGFFRYRDAGHGFWASFFWPFDLGEVIAGWVIEARK